VLWCAYVAQPVIVPLLLAWSIATIMLPVVRWLQDLGVPRVAAILAVTVLLLIVITALLMVLSAPLTYWLGRAAELGMILKEKLRTISQPLAFLEEFRNAISSVGGGTQPILKVEQQPATAATVFSIVTPAVSQTVLFVGALIFYLVYQKRLRDTAVFLLKDRDARLLALRALSDVDEHMTTFFGTFTIVNICLGLVTAMLTWFVGLPNPLLWGVLAGVLNYVPYVGPAIVTATLAVVSLLTFSTLGEAVVAPLIFLAVVTVEGHFLTPMFMGRRLELNPFAVFLSIAVWTWLWGPIGAFLAVPMLIALSVTLGHVFAESKPELPE
jgi:predicted PurR-regulated permease PerM